MVTKILVTNILVANILVTNILVTNFGYQHFSNQHISNRHFSDQHYGSQYFSSQNFGNQHFINQSFSKQHFCILLVLTTGKQFFLKNIVAFSRWVAFNHLKTVFHVFFNRLAKVFFRNFFVFIAVELIKEFSKVEKNVNENSTFLAFEQILNLRKMVLFLF